MLTTARNASLLVAFQKSFRVVADLFRVFAHGSDTKKSICGVCQDIHNRTQDPIDTESLELLAHGAGHVLGKFLLASRHHSHVTWELCEICFVIEVVEHSIFLVNCNEKRILVVSSVCYIL